MIEDWDCLELARQGDEAAWRLIFLRHYPSLVRMIFCVTGSMDSAEDLVQESFVRLLRVEAKHREGSFRAFLSTIAYRLALKERKRQSVRESLHGLEFVDQSLSPLENTIRDETGRIVFRVLQSLTHEQREILALRFYGGHSYEEIAAIVGVPIGTVKSRIFYSIKTCRQMLRDQGVFT